MPKQSCFQQIRNQEYRAAAIPYGINRITNWNCIQRVDILNDVVLVCTAGLELLSPTAKVSVNYVTIR